MHVIVSGSCMSDRRNRQRHSQVPRIQSIQCSVRFFVLLLPSPEAFPHSDQSIAVVPGDYSRLSRYVQAKSMFVSGIVNQS
jgi:hypothetical protein